MNVGVSTQKSLSKIIGEMAVIASVHSKVLGLTRIDKQASAESDRAHNAKQGTMKGIVMRMSGAEGPIEEIKKVDRAGRKLLMSWTTQWGNDRRLLPNQFIGDFSGEFDVLRRERERLVKEFKANAKAYLATAKQNLGSYSVQPPTLEEIDSAFAFGFELTPVPDASAYTTGDKALQDTLKQRFENDVRDSFAQSQKDLFERLAEPLENLVKRMAEYDKREADKAKGFDVGKTGTFKSTIVTNITDISSIMRSFNFTNDSKINEIADKLDVFKQIGHEDLTKSRELRVEVAKRAADIRKSLGAWLD